MKKQVLCLLMLCLLGWGTSFAQFSAPTRYDLKDGQLHVTYNTVPMPRFTYSQGRQALVFTGQEIQITSTPAGTMLTVTILKTVDSGSTTFTLLLPKVNVKLGSSAKISAVAITTRHKWSLARMANEGQADLYTTTTLSGMAASQPF